MEYCEPFCTEDVEILFELAKEGLENRISKDWGDVNIRKTARSFKNRNIEDQYQVELELLEYIAKELGYTAEYWNSVITELRELKLFWLNITLTEVKDNKKENK